VIWAENIRPTHADVTSDPAGRALRGGPAGVTETAPHAARHLRGGRGSRLLITGPSGSGKSALALQMMALGAGWWRMTAPIWSPRDDALHATCPPACAA
jgi:ABC-type uncharacterized transport system fused permease/ATPase subunit